MKKITLTILSLVFISCFTQAQIINTVAGSCNGDSARTFGLGMYAVAVDDSSNAYISDPGHCAVYKISKSGIITIVAGNNKVGYSGDGGPATDATLDNPQGVAVDKSGNIYIADQYNNVVRMVTKGGIISTLAGNSYRGYAGDGGPATDAKFYQPAGVAADGSGNVYISDGGNARIRVVNPAGIVTTYAGTGVSGHTGDGGPATAAKIYGPAGIKIDTKGNLYIADNNIIRKVNSAGIISTIAGKGGFGGYNGDGGPATAALFNYSMDVAVDSSGNVYVADQDNNVIRKINSAGIITTFAGDSAKGVGFSGDGGPANIAQLNQPTGVSADPSGNIYAVDWYNNRLRKVNTSGIINSVVGNGTAGYCGDGSPATIAELYNPRGVAIDGSGNIYIADRENNLVRKVNTVGVMSTVAGNGQIGFSGDGGPATAANLWGPNGVAADDSGNVFIADFTNNRIRKVSKTGIITSVAGSGAGGYSGDTGPATAAKLWNPTGIAIDDSGNMFISDQYNNVIRKVRASTGIITTYAGDGYGSGTGAGGNSGDGGQAKFAELNMPTGVAVDDSGNIFIADIYNNRIRKVNKAGIITTLAGSGTQPYAGDGGPATAAGVTTPGVAVDVFGNVYIADGGNNRIRRVNKAGIISTVAGDSLQGFSGDGGLATSARLNGPVGIVTDISGNIYIVDESNNRIRKVNTAPLSVNEITNKTDIIIYPVPNNGTFTVQLGYGSQLSAINKIEIYNILGEKVYSQPISATQNSLSLNLDLFNGIYILEIITDRGVIKKKIEVIK